MEHNNPTPPDPNDPQLPPMPVTPPVTPASSGKPYPYDLPEPANPPVATEREGQDLPDPPKRHRPRPEPPRTPEQVVEDARRAEQRQVHEQQMLVVAANTREPLPDVMSVTDIMDWQNATYTLIARDAAAMAGIMASTARLVEQSTRLATRAGQHTLEGEADPNYLGAQTDDPIGLQMQLVATELSAMLSMSKAVIGTLMHTSEMLVNDLPQTMDALEEGGISMKHADIIVKHANQIPPSSRKKFEAVLVPIAKTTNINRLGEKAKAVREKMHPETAIVRHKKAREKRCVRFEANNDGMATLTAFIPATQAKGIMSRLTDTARRMRSKEDGRTLNQLRADVFQDLLICGNTTSLPYNLGIRAQVAIMMDYSTMMGQDDNPAQLDGYGFIDANVGRDLVERSTAVRRIIVDATGKVLNVGTKRYRGGRSNEQVPVLAIEPWEQAADFEMTEPNSTEDDDAQDDTTTGASRQNDDNQWIA